MTSDKEIDKTPHIRLICYPHDLDTGVKTTVDIMDILMKPDVEDRKSVV